MKDYILRTIKRKKKNSYSYEFFNSKHKKISQNTADKHMKGLYIPPAYDNVKINLNKNDKILAIGYDQKNRAQYIYNKKFTKKRENRKFKHMIHFGESYRKIMNQIKRDIYSEGDNKNKQIAMALMLVINCGIRIGSEKYKRENNSYGATTLESRHVKINNDMIEVDFIGKKGVINKGKIKSKKLSKNMKMKKRTINKNEPIFTYRMGNKWYKLKSSDVNLYLKKFGNFTSKNFRTWDANLIFITELLKTEKDVTETKRKHIINETLKKVAEKLNNTTSVCKHNYIDPFIRELYLNNPSRFWISFKGGHSKEEISEKYIELLRNN